MDLRDEMERLRRPTSTALDQYAQGRQEDKLAASTSPVPGAVYLFEETAESAVFWAVAEHDPGDERFLLVAADGNMLVGSTDVAVPPEADGGPLSLRCSAEIRLEEADFERAMRIGLLDAGQLQRISHKREQMPAGNPESTVTERETDVDVEYQDWQDQLKVAQSELFRGLRRRRAGQSGDEQPDASVVENSAKTSRASASATAQIQTTPAGELLQPTRWTKAGRLYGLAASALVVASLALSGELYRQSQSAEQDLATIRSKHSTEIEHQSAKHDQELEQLADKHREELGRLNREQAGTEDFYQKQIRELREHLSQGDPSTASIEPQVNVPFALFSPMEPVRGQSKTLSASKADRFFVLLFDVTELYSTYRLTILEKRTGEIMWISSPLRRTGIAELALVVDSEFLTPGRYTLQLDGLDDESTQPVGSFTLQLESD